jgi:hypothetical protein
MPLALTAEPSSSSTILPNGVGITRFHHVVIKIRKKFSYFRLSDLLLSVRQHLTSDFQLICIVYYVYSSVRLYSYVFLSWSTYSLAIGTIDPPSRCQRNLILKHWCSTDLISNDCLLKHNTRTGSQLSQLTSKMMNEPYRSLSNANRYCTINFIVNTPLSYNIFL